MRLPETVRDKLLKAVAASVRAVMKDNGHVDATLVPAQYLELLKLIGRIGARPRRITDFFAGLFLRCLAYAEPQAPSSPSIAEKVAVKLKELRLEAIWDLQDRFGHEAEAVAQALGHGDLFDEQHEAKWLAEHQAAKQLRDAEAALVRTPLAPPPDVLAEEIVSDFESWPRLYDLIVELPFPYSIFEGVFGDRCVLSDSVRIEILPDNDRETLHLKHLDSSYVLRAAVDGYELVETDSYAFGEVEAVTRQFLGLAMAVGLIEVDSLLNWESKIPYVAVELGQTTATDFAASNFKLPDGTTWSNECELAKEDAVVVGSLVLALKYSNSQYGRRLADQGASYYLNRSDWERDQSRLRGALHEIGFAFRQNDARLLSAGEWLFGSYAGTNQALQMVQAMTVLEILYGGEADDHEQKKKDREKARRERAELSTTALLANSVAYSLGRNPADRKRYEKQFKALYDARSRIVHAGLRRLDDETQLEGARELAKKAIRRELRFLSAEETV